MPPYTNLLRVLISSTLASLLLVPIGCGGGGGDGDGGNMRPPEPTPGSFPVSPPGNGPSGSSSAKVILRNGNAAGDGFVIGNIEDAALASDGSIAVIAAAENDEGRAILRRDADGTLRNIFGSGNAPANIDLTTLARLRMAPTGELAFRSGKGLDSDQLHVAPADEVRTIAGSSGAQAPDFRLLGNFRIVRGGRVAFTAGGGDCDAEPSGDSVRYLCTVALFVADEDRVTQIVHPEFLLNRRQANDAQIAMNEDGDLFFSVPARRTSPSVVRFENGRVEVILRNDQEIPELGNVNRIDIVDLDLDGRLLVELGLEPETEDDPVLDQLGFLDRARFVPFAREGVFEGDELVFGLRGLGLGGGQAMFQTTLLDTEADTSRACLRLGDRNDIIEILCEGEPFPAEELEVFSISGTRINSVGDVLFVTILGRQQGETRIIEETRATVRRADGEFVTIASSADSENLGIITDLTTVGFNDAGQALLIAERSRSSDRVLLLGESAE